MLKNIYTGADPGFLDSGFKFIEGENDLLIVADYLLFFLVFLKILHENVIVLSQRGFERTPLNPNCIQLEPQQNDLLIVADYLLIFLVFLKIIQENVIVLSQRGFERTP